MTSTPEKHHGTVHSISWPKIDPLIEEVKSLKTVFIHVCVLARSALSLLQSEGLVGSSLGEKVDLLHVCAANVSRGIIGRQSR